MKNLELLKKVRRVEAPPFMLTRIHAKIRVAEVERMPAWGHWAGALAVGLLLFLNIFAMKTEGTPSLAPADQIAESLHLQTSNQLYDE